MIAAVPVPVSSGPLDRVERRRRRRALLGYLSPVTVFYVLFLVVPYLLLFRMSLNRFSSTRMYIEDITVANYVEVLTSAYYLSLIGRTLALTLLVTIATLVVAYPLALEISRRSGVLKTVLIGVALSPLLINLVVRTYAWLVVLGDRGVINTWLQALGIVSGPLPLSGNLFAVVVGLVHVCLPLMILSLVGVMETIDGSVIEAAESLGAGSGRIIARVVFPLSLPGIASGCLLVFCFSVSAFVTPALLGGNRVSTVSTVIYEKFTFSLNWPVGASLVFVLLGVNLLAIAAHGRLFRER